MLASLVWSLFNAGYVVYLSFAPGVLVAGGYEMVSALGVISLASWLMIFSGIACGLIADRSGQADLVLYICIVAAIFSLLMLFITHLAIPSSLMFGLLGMAPAGVIMALTTQAMKSENRAVGMGLLFYNILSRPGPRSGHRRLVIRSDHGRIVANPFRGHSFSFYRYREPRVQICTKALACMSQFLEIAQKRATTSASYVTAILMAAARAKSAKPHRLSHKPTTPSLQRCLT